MVYLLDRSSLGAGVLRQMALRIALVILVITGISYWHVYRGITETTLDTLNKYVHERGERESLMFFQAEDNLRDLMRSFRRQEPLPFRPDVGREFGRMMQKDADGAWRRRPGFDVQREPSAFIGRDVNVDPEIRYRMLIMMELVRDYGRAWANRYATTYLADMKGMAATYWPGVDWYLTTPADVRFADYSWVQNADKTRNPDRNPAWTGIWYDWVAKNWFTTCILPEDEDGAFRYYAGTALSLDAILARTQEKRLTGTENVIFRADGRLISHPREDYMETMKARGGEFEIMELGDPHLQAIYKRVRDQGRGGIAELPEYGEYLGVAKIAGPGWYFVTVLPKEMLAKTAYASAEIILWLGVLALVVELAIVGWIIKRRISTPLGYFVDRVGAVGAGNLNARVALDGEDELGRLARAFNGMAETLHRDQIQLRDYAESLERKVQERTAQLETKEKAKTRFLAAASHDLRQPIQAIGLFLDSLRRTDLNASQSRIVAHIDRSVASLKDLLSSLLDISRLDAGMVVPVYRAIPVSQLFASLDAEFSCLALERGLRFKFYFPHRELWILTDQRLLAVVLRNLVANALNYTVSGGLMVGVRRRGDRLAIQVWDTGIGIEKADQAHIFDEFFQVANPQRDQSKGLGLGLAIASRTARVLNCPMRCCSRPGKGSMFEIVVPLCPSCAECPGDDDGQVNVALWQGKKFLVLEDDERVAEALVTWLASIGARASRFTSAEEALGTKDVMDADAYICDFRLPGSMNGIAFLEAVDARREGPTVRAVVITGDTAPDFIAMSSMIPWRVLHKPVDPRQLLKVLEMG